MISDVFAEAVQEIDRYLTDAVFQQTYQGDMRSRIISLRDAMEALRKELDTPPCR